MSLRSPFAPRPVDATSAASDFVTVRDFVRHAVSEFGKADLVHGHGAATAFDEAVYLVLETLSLPIDTIEPFWDARLAAPERQALADVIQARVTSRKPAAYLTRRAWIQGVPFYVDETVIVPRSYIGELFASGMFTGGTEDGGGLSLVEDPEAVTRVLDLCTGSGCLAVLAAMLFPNARIDAVDLSGAALEVARVNVADHGLEDRIELLQGDLFDPLAGRRYDLIITNPPYVDAAAMAELPPEYRAEPAIALAAGEDGLDLVHRILEAAPSHLNPGGGLVCEIGRCRPALEEARPDLDFLWLQTAESFGEVFWLDAAQLSRKRPRRARS